MIIYISIVPIAICVAFFIICLNVAIRCYMNKMNLKEIELSAIPINDKMAIYKLSNTNSIISNERMILDADKVYDIVPNSSICDNGMAIHEFNSQTTKCLPKFMDNLLKQSFTSLGTLPDTSLYAATNNLVKKLIYNTRLTAIPGKIAEIASND